MFHQIFGELNEISYKFQKNFGQNVKRKMKKNIDKFEANFEKLKKLLAKFTKPYIEKII